jgi:hypothetical protein
MKAFHHTKLVSQGQGQHFSKGQGPGQFYSQGHSSESEQHEGRGERLAEREIRTDGATTRKSRPSSQELLVDELEGRNVGKVQRISRRQLHEEEETAKMERIEKSEKMETGVLENASSSSSKPPLIQRKVIRRPAKTAVASDSDQQNSAAVVDSLPGHKPTVDNNNKARSRETRNNGVMVTHDSKHKARSRTPSAERPPRPSTCERPSSAPLITKTGLASTLTGSLRSLHDAEHGNGESGSAKKVGTSILTLKGWNVFLFVCYFFLNFVLLSDK